MCIRDSGQRGDGEAQRGHGHVDGHREDRGQEVAGADQVLPPIDDGPRPREAERDVEIRGGGEGPGGEEEEAEAIGDPRVDEEPRGAEPRETEEEAVSYTHLRAHETPEQL